MLPRRHRGYDGSMQDEQKLLRWTLAILAFWSVPVVLGLCRCVVVAGPDVAIVPTLGAAFRLQAAEWYPWALLTPVVWALGRRLGPPNTGWRVAIPLHLFLGVAVCFVYAVLSTAVRLLLGAESSFTFLDRVFGLLISSLHVHYLIYWAVLGVGWFLSMRTSSRRPDAPDRIVIKTPGAVVIVPFADICFVSAADQYIQVQTGARSLLSRESLSEMEKRLPREQFYRIHRSTIVNLAHVERLKPGQHGEYTVKLRGGHSLQASRARSSGLREVLAN